MKDEIKKEIDEVTPEAIIPIDAVSPVDVSSDAKPEQEQDGKRGGFRNSRGGGSREKNQRKSTRERVKPEFDSKTIVVKRVARVVSGGRRFQFSVAVVCGNRKGMVGVGLGKGADTAVAVEKATRNAKKNMIKVLMTKNNSIPHEVWAKFSACRVMLAPARGRGLIAGSSTRVVLELAGVKDVMGKIMSGSKNKLNNARAAIEALKQLRAIKQRV